jgi:hypothetical protein
MNRTPEDLARHEGAHALIFLLHGIRPDYLHLAGCHCPPAAPPTVTATAALAGHVANRGAGVADYPSDSDRRALVTALGQLGESYCPRVIRHYEQEAGRLLGRWWSQLDALQAVLLREKHLTFDGFQLATITDPRLRQFRHLFPARRLAEKQRVQVLGKSRGQWRTAQTGCNIFGGVRRT